MQQSQRFHETMQQGSALFAQCIKRKDYQCVSYLKDKDALVVAKARQNGPLTDGLGYKSPEAG